MLLIGVYSLFNMEQAPADYPGMEGKYCMTKGYIVHLKNSVIVKQVM